MMMPHVRTVNEYLWERGYLGNEVVFKSSQTPLIYDPMSTIVFGYASCTGEGWLGLSSAVKRSIGLTTGFHNHGEGPY